MEVIRFQCPACSASLTVPPSAAGFRGPCPKCSVEIIGPNPALDLAASLPNIAPPAAHTFEPFPEKPASAAAMEAPPQEPPPELIPPTDPFAGTIQPHPSEPVSWPQPPAAPDEPIEEAEEDRKAEEEPLPEPIAEEKAEPFKDFTPSEPEPTRAPETAIVATPPASPVSRISVLVVACLLCTVLAFVAGIKFGNRTPHEESPISPSKQSDIPNEKSEPIPDPVPAHNPAPAPLPTLIPDVKSNVKSDDSDQARIVGPEATLNAFLDADGWASRSAYVMFPESIRQRMEAHSKKSDDGPIETTGISLFEVTEQAHIFTISTQQVPEGFPVAVSRDGNSWLVDWETFIEFHDDRFNRFAAGKEGDHGIFHLLIKPAKAEGNDTYFQRFLLNPPMPERERTAYIKKGSVPLARIQGIFERKAGQPDEVFDKLMEGQGPPMVVALSYKVNSEGKSYLEIEDFVAIGWGPAEP